MCCDSVFWSCIRRFVLFAYPGCLGQLCGLPQDAASDARVATRGGTRTRVSSYLGGFLLSGGLFGMQREARRCKHFVPRTQPGRRMLCCCHTLSGCSLCAERRRSLFLQPSQACVSLSIPPPPAPAPILLLWYTRNKCQTTIPARVALLL